MNISINKYIVLTLLALSLISATSHAQTTGSAFSYQGELLDNGSPANGDYDITVKLFIPATGGSSTDEVDFPDTTVVNGLFNLEVDFGDMVYEDLNQYYIEIEVTPSAGGASVVLSPRTKLLSVPYATQSQFGGESSPWNTNGISLTSPGKVGVGEPSPSAQLHVTNNQSQISLLKVDDVSDTRMVIQATGKTGIGVNGPSDRLHVSAELGEDALRVQVDGGTKLRVLSNGGTALGVNATPPDNGLYVSGDVKQSEDSNGMLKYMLRATCDATPTIDGEYNGTNVAGTAGITSNGTGNCTITLPINISSNFISVSPIRATSGNNRIASCVPFLSGMICQMSVGSTGADVNGSFHVLVY